MTKTELSYIAGFIDGEGCLTVSFSKRPRNVTVFSARVVIVNTDKPIINWLLKKIGGSCRKKQNPKAHHKMSYHVTLSAQHRVVKFLKAIYPYLKVKKRQAKIIINILNHRSKGYRSRTLNRIGKKEICALNSIRKLNKKGRAV